MEPSCGKETVDRLRAKSVIHHVPVHGFDVDDTAIQVENINTAINVTNALGEVENAHGIAHIHGKDCYMTEGVIRDELSFHPTRKDSGVKTYRSPTLVDFTPMRT